MTANPILLNRYELVSPLGRGGFGQVYLAHDRALDDRPVAIKMAEGTLAQDPDTLEAVKAEAVLAMMLSHPNIATLRAFEMDHDLAFLVIDYVQGEAL